MATISIKQTGSGIGFRLVALASAVFGLFAGQVRSAAVDTELLLLVDTSNVALFFPSNVADTVIEYEAAFRSQEIIDGLTGGPIGSTAASMVFYSGPGNQAVAVGWTPITDRASSEAFAAAIAASIATFANPLASAASALAFAQAYFGDETAGPPNGFESNTQVIHIASETGVVPAESAAALQAARDAALASGVDVVNAVTTGTLFAGATETFYTDNLIGGSVGGTPATYANAPDFASLPAVLVPALEAELLAAVPEPGSILLFALGSMLVLRRRRS